jgi:hypothetical protein
MEHVKDSQPFARTSFCSCLYGLCKDDHEEDVVEAVAPRAPIVHRSVEPSKPSIFGLGWTIKAFFNNIERET